MVPSAGSASATASELYPVKTPTSSVRRAPSNWTSNAMKLALLGSDLHLRARVRGGLFP